MTYAMRDTRMSAEAYLAWEDHRQREEGKHEYSDGRLVPMIGASFAHDTIAMNVKMLLWTQLRETPYRAHSGDIRVHIDAANCYYYPDCSVCPAGAPASATTTRNPVVIVEVLSPSTRHRDRTEKLGNYQTLASVQDILLIEQAARRVEHHTRGLHGWIVDVITKDGSVALASLGIALPMAALYDGLDDLA